MIGDADRQPKNEALWRAVERALKSPVTSSRAAGGGSIATSFEVDLANGVEAFVKTHPHLPHTAFEREAEGLAWLGEAGAVRVPRVLAVGELDGLGGSAGFLVLERVRSRGRAPERRDDERFGRELAALHRFGAPSFGLLTSNYLALLPQDNRSTPSWQEFYRARRLEPLLALATDKGLCPRRTRASFDRLFAVLPERVGPSEPPARLHGDLWAGNRVLDEAGASVLVDPAVYGGHREIDLAMMRLFGGFGSHAFTAYDEAFPLARGHEERVGLYQLYPLLAHLVMFGLSYLEQVEEAVERLL